MDVLAVKVLQYGVLGLCAVMLVATWRIIAAEQKRQGQPRKDILKYSMVFMVFCVALAVVNGYVQLAEGQKSKIAEERLSQIRAAAMPLLSARVPTIESLPDSPQKSQLLVFQRELVKALGQGTGHR